MVAMMMVVLDEGGRRERYRYAVMECKLNQMNNECQKSMFYRQARIARVISAKTRSGRIDNDPSET